MKRKFTYIIITLFFASFASFVYAQTLLPTDGDFSNTPGVGISASDIDIDMDPEYPSAFDTVTIRLDSNIVDLNRVPLSWYVNGSKILDGTGQRTLSTKIGDYGSVNDVAVRITIGNKTIQKTIDLSPADITVMYEALDAYVPPFYPGKKLLPTEGVARIVAFPNFNSDGAIMDSSKGVYIWKRNKKNLTGAGGYGKNYITIKNDKLIGSETFSVRASNAQNTVSGEKGFELIPQEPKIHFYQKVWNQPNFSQALDGGFTLSGNSATVVAIPYFFSKVDNLWSGTTINWYINNSPLVIEDQKNPFTLVLNNPGSGGSNKLKLSLESSINLFQEAVREFTVGF